MRKTVVYVDITFINEFGMLRLVKLLPAGENQLTRVIDMQWQLRRMALLAIGHLLQQVSRVCSLFLRRGGTTTCEVTGPRRSNVHNNDAHIINFTVFLFSCVKFSWNQLTSKIYYRQKFPDLRYVT